MSPRLVQLSYYLVIAAATIVPLLLHVILGWWAGLLSWLLLVWFYGHFFTIRGSICMGMGFFLPFITIGVLLLWNTRDLIVWLMR